MIMLTWIWITRFFQVPFKCHIPNIIKQYEFQNQNTNAHVNTLCDVCVSRGFVPQSTLWSRRGSWWTWTFPWGQWTASTLWPSMVPSSERWLIHDIHDWHKFLPLSVRSSCFLLDLFQGDVWICMELMDTSLDKFYKKVIEKGKTIPEDILGKITVAVSAVIFYSASLWSHRELACCNHY